MTSRSEIPPRFHSEYEGGPFEACAVCGCSLNDPDVSYTISKTCNQGEAIVEMAICHPCGEELSNEFSQASTEAIRHFMNTKVFKRVFHSLGDHAEAHQHEEGAGDDLGETTAESADPEALVVECALCGKRRDTCRTFTVTALCVGDEMIVSSLESIGIGTPMMLCDDCNNEASELLSKETRDSLNRFYEDVIDTPPQITLGGPVAPALF